MTTELEVSLTRLLNDLRGIRTLLEQNKTMLTTLSNFSYNDQIGILNHRIESLKNNIEFAKKVPSAFAYAKIQVSLSNLMFIDILNINSKLRKNYRHFPQTEPEKKIALRQLIDDLRELIDVTLYRHTLLIKLAQEKAELQFQKPARIDKDRIINLIITYGGANAPGNPLFSLLTQNIKYNRPITGLQDIEFFNDKILRAISAAFASEFFIRLFGEIFKKNVQIYVYAEERFIPTMAGCLKKIIHIVQSTFGKEHKVFFVPSIEDMRFCIEVEYLKTSSVSELESTMIHEIMHAFDEKLSYRNEQRAQRVYDVVRDEGLARFQQVVHNPESLYKFKTQYDIMWSEALFNKPFNLATLADKANKDREFVYGLGLLIMLQLFCALISIKLQKKIPEKTSVLFFLQKISPLDVEQNQETAFNLQNIVRLMDSKKFFAFYEKKVDKPVFDKSLFYYISKEK